MLYYGHPKAPNAERDEHLENRIRAIQKHGSQRENAMEKLRIYFVARRLQLRDKGELKPEFVKTTAMNDLFSRSFGVPDIDEMMTGGRWRTLICKQCRENVRIGVRRTGGKAVHWCWRCEWAQDIESGQPVHDDDNFLEEHGLRF